MALTKLSNSMLVQPVNHNILINPSFTVKQRGDVIDHNTVSHGPDRWLIRGLDGVGGTMSQSTTVVDPTTGINKLLVKHPRDATYPIKSYAWSFQYIEAVNLLGLYGKEMTFSFGYTDVGGSGIPIVRIQSYDSSDTLKVLYDAVPTSLGDSRWTCTFTLSTDDGTIPDPSERGMQVTIWPNERNNAPSEWSLWETKLEVGSVVTPFIARSHGEELALCQRYYFEPSDLLVSDQYAIFQGNVVNQDSYNSTFYLPVSMRTSPTFTVTVGSNTGFDGAFISVVSLSGQSGRASCACNANKTNGFFYFTITADAEL